MSVAAADAFVEAELTEGRHGFRSRWYRTPAFVAGIVIVGTVLGLAVLAPVIAPYDPTKQDLQHILQNPVEDALARHRPARSRRVVAHALRPRGSTCVSAFLAVLLPFLHRDDAGRIARLLRPLRRHAHHRGSPTIVVAFPFYVLVIAMVFVLGPGTRNIYMAMTVGRLGVVHADHPR